MHIHTDSFLKFWSFIFLFSFGFCFFFLVILYTCIRFQGNKCNRNANFIWLLRGDNFRFKSFITTNLYWINRRFYLYLYISMQWEPLNTLIGFQARTIIINCFSFLFSFWKFDWCDTWDESVLNREKENTHTHIYI